jgi:hypothetical protein
VDIDGVWHGVHPHPVRKEKSDFLISSVVEMPDGAEGFEQLFARKVTDSEYEICCIPGYSYGLSLGDVVKTSAYGGIGHVVSEVLRASGHSTFRIWFGDKYPEGPASEAVQSVLANVVGPGVLTEWCSRNYVAIDAAPGVDTDTIASVLERLEQQGLIETFEVGNLIPSS